MPTRAEAVAEARQALAEFVLLLENEAQALENLQTDDLARLVAAKADCANRAASAWQDLILALGGDPSRDPRTEALLCADAEGTRDWQEISRLARAAAGLNQTNGILIAAQLRRTRQAIDILQNAANGGRLYGENGHILGALASQRTLDKA